MRSLNSRLHSAFCFDSPWCLCLLTDCPTSLKSSDMPVEASIEDLHANAEQLYQGDAMPASNLEVKLEQEFNYHKHGSYNYPDRPNAGPPRPSVEVGREDQREVPWRARPPLHVSTVQSWTKNDPVPGVTLENFPSFSSQSTPSPSVVVPPMASPDWSPLYQYAPQHEQAQLHSSPIPESESPDSSMGFKSGMMLPYLHQGISTCSRLIFFAPQHLPPALLRLTI